MTDHYLKEFIIKGYVMDDARLREPENLFGKDYFEEQLELSLIHIYTQYTLASAWTYQNDEYP